MSRNVFFTRARNSPSADRKPSGCSGFKEASKPFLAEAMEANLAAVKFSLDNLLSFNLLDMGNRDASDFQSELETLSTHADKTNRIAVRIKDARVVEVTSAILVAISCARFVDLTRLQEKDAEHLRSTFSDCLSLVSGSEIR
ncbi:hypothetical protein GF318_01990 [Candidatus Micrarchaeota archaeon]|nr:hypothetical protein [Candidatus Micrarchaeota archaeon]